MYKYKEKKLVTESREEELKEMAGRRPQHENKVDKLVAMLMEEILPIKPRSDQSWSVGEGGR